MKTSLSLGESQRYPCGKTSYFCFIDIVECTSEKCGSKGQCLEKRGGGVVCVCDKGSTGSDCRANIDDCRRGLCKNGATCRDKIGSFECICQPGWDGLYCHIKV